LLVRAAGHYITAGRLLQKTVEVEAFKAVAKRLFELQQSDVCLTELVSGACTPLEWCYVQLCCGLRTVYGYVLYSWSALSCVHRTRRLEETRVDSLAADEAAGRYSLLQRVYSASRVTECFV